jgi:hypothetical protein
MQADSRQQQRREATSAKQQMQPTHDEHVKVNINNHLCTKEASVDIVKISRRTESFF